MQSAFEDYGRGDSFSREGFEALADYLEDSYPDVEFDVIGIDCEWCEYATAVEAASEYGYTYEASDEDGEEHGEQASLDWLRDQTTVIEFTGGIIIQGF